MDKKSRVNVTNDKSARCSRLDLRKKAALYKTYEIKSPFAARLKAVTNLG